MAALSKRRLRALAEIVRCGPAVLERGVWRIPGSPWRFHGLTFRALARAGYLLPVGMGAALRLLPTLQGRQAVLSASAGLPLSGPKELLSARVEIRRRLDLPATTLNGPVPRIEVRALRRAAP